MEKNAQNVADDNNVKSSNNVEIVHQNKRATENHQVEQTSDMEGNEITGEHKSYISAVHGEAK